MEKAGLTHGILLNLLAINTDLIPESYIEEKGTYKQFNP